MAFPCILPPPRAVEAVGRGSSAKDRRRRHQDTQDHQEHQRQIPDPGGGEAMPFTPQENYLICLDGSLGDVLRCGKRVSDVSFREQLDKHEESSTI